MATKYEGGSALRIEAAICSQGNTRAAERDQPKEQGWPPWHPDQVLGRTWSFWKPEHGVTVLSPFWRRRH